MNNLTVICHFYNEEYLLPWWLRHHAKIFKHGIMIDYASTDNSRAIIKDMCPTWDIVDSRNKVFQINAIDDEVTDIERQITGWRMCLNVTEYLYGNYNLLGQDNIQQWKIPSCGLVDTEFNRPYDVNKDIIDQVRTGFTYKTWFEDRWARAARNFTASYPPGRHFREYDTEELMVFWTGFAPMNDTVIDRKLQIGTRVPDADIRLGMGLQHRLTRDQLINKWKGHYVNISIDIGESIDNMISLHTKVLGYR